jgi:hypothetical protein
MYYVGPAGFCASENGSGGAEMLHPQLFFFFFAVLQFEFRAYTLSHSTSSFL